ncbi:DUF1559 domain-containing protein [Rhodopirellula bahusiensis]|uniref:DUF1559 domain-containing protein n=1 Tax=Rhodopirellula bahusiensis TaxID=2014065 RepID=UPI0032647DFB
MKLKNIGTPIDREFNQVVEHIAVVKSHQDAGEGRSHSIDNQTSDWCLGGLVLLKPFCATAQHCKPRHKTEVVFRLAGDQVFGVDSLERKSIGQLSLAASECFLHARVMRYGFTLIELLVSISIIGILVGMLIPAVQTAREMARKTQCSNHLKQLCTAAMLHEGSLGHLPSGGWGKSWAGIGGLGSGPDQPGGWIVQVLPYVEQASLQQLGGFQLTDESANGKRLATPIAVLHCPSRRGAELYQNSRGWQPLYHPLLPMVARNDYAINGGGAIVRYGPGPASIEDARTYVWPDMSSNTGVSYQRSRLQLRDITDGLSNTYMLGEKQLPFTSYGGGNNLGDNESAYSGDDRDLVRYVGKKGEFRFAPVSDSFVVEEEGAIFGSAHATGFQMALCDGSVRFLSYSIDHEIHRRLGERNDGDNAGIP